MTKNAMKIEDWDSYYDSCQENQVIPREDMGEFNRHWAFMEQSRHKIKEIRYPDDRQTGIKARQSRLV